MIDEDFDDDRAFDDEQRVCPITGKREKKTLISVLNKKGKINKHELDEIFLDDSY